jgi:hypothetical protein
MTEPIPEPTTAAVAETEEVTTAATDDNAEEPQTIEAAKKLRSENRNLRQRLRDAERARDEVQAAREVDLAKLAEYERREVERAAATVLVDPEDIWRHTDEATQAQFNDEFGAIVGDNVVEVAKKLAAQRPHLARPNTAPPPSDRPIEGLRGGASPEPKKTEVTWSSALRRSI